MTVKQRLIALVGVLMVGLVMVGAIALNSALSCAHDMHKIGEERVPGLLYIGNLNTERMIIRAQTLDVLTLKNDYNVKEKFVDIAKQREQSWKVVDENWNKFKDLPRGSEKGRQTVAKLTSEYEAWRTVYTELDGIISKLASNNDKETQDKLMVEYQDTIAKMVPISNAMGATMTSLIETNVGVTLKMISESTVSADSRVIITIVVMIICIVAGVVLAILVLKNILTSLAKVRNGLDSFFAFLNKKSDKVQNIDLHTQDEFGTMSKVINENIDKTYLSIQKDNEFVKEVARFVSELKTGNMLARIEKDSDTPSLKELKQLLVELQYYLEHTIARDLNVLVSVLESYKNQDFTARFPNPYAKVAIIIDELGDSICDLLKQSLTVGKSLEYSSGNLIENVEILNTSANQAAASLEETAAALEEITATVVSNSTHVSEMTNYSSQVSISAKKGQELARSTTTAMDDITSQVNAISDAISVIDQIAFQTNILSLNAAVEAATAGEAGKGFAVVAQEVRNLAARSAEAAKEIKSIVENATNKANQGKNISNEMIKGYEELLVNITKTTQVIDEIAKASKEQEAGITQINDAVTGLDQQTQQNASIASQTQEIALQTDKIAKEIVADAMSKEFIGKDSIKNQPINHGTSHVKVPEVKKNTAVPNGKISKISLDESGVSKRSSGTSKNDEWESF
ncbi:MAG: methyl-accepting chemotaxis protein [Arcobacteraceae bacterium]|nr:methyl-accepting chemotaxis protein [Arcobacteraceae bacterium]